MKYWIASFLIEEEDGDISCQECCVEARSIKDAAEVAGYIIRNKFDVKHLLIHSIGLCANQDDHADFGTFWYDDTMELDDFMDIDW